MRAIFFLSPCLALGCGACASTAKAKPGQVTDDHGATRKAGFGAAGDLLR